MLQHRALVDRALVGDFTAVDRQRHIEQDGAGDPRRGSGCDGQKFCQSLPERCARFLASATGSSTRITRAILLDTPLSIDRGEVTDKGSINQRAVLEYRAGLIEVLYSSTPPAQVITLN